MCINTIALKYTSINHQVNVKLDEYNTIIKQKTIFLEIKEG